MLERDFNVVIDRNLYKVEYVPMQGNNFYVMSQKEIIFPKLKKILMNIKKVKYTEKLDGIIRIINMQEN